MDARWLFGTLLFFGIFDFHEDFHRSCCKEFTVIYGIMIQDNTYFMIFSQKYMENITL